MLRRNTNTIPNLAEIYGLLLVVEGLGEEVRDAFAFAVAHPVVGTPSETWESAMGTA